MCFVDVGKLMALIYVYGAADMFNVMVQIIMCLIL